MLSFGAMRTEVVGTPDLDWADDREKGFGAEFLEVRRVTARTGNRQQIGIRWLELQQLRHGGGPGLMHGGTDSGLDALQIEAAGRLAPAENGTQQLFYFARDFLLDGLRRFFSWAVCSVCWTGRRRQILRLTLTKSPVKSWNFRYSAISLSAFRIAAGEGKVCETVLPSIF